VGGLLVTLHALGRSVSGAEPGKNLPPLSLSIDVTEGSYRDIFRAIESQAHLKIVAPLTTDEGKVTWKVEDMALEELLDAVSQRLDCTWAVQGDCIVLKKRPEALPPLPSRPVKGRDELVALIRTLTPDQLATLGQQCPLDLSRMLPEQREQLPVAFTLNDREWQAICTSERAVFGVFFHPCLVLSIPAAEGMPARKLPPIFLMELSGSKIPPPSSVTKPTAFTVPPSMFKDQQGQLVPARPMRKEHQP